MYSWHTRMLVMMDENTASEAILAQLVGEQLSAVTFVQNYLQLAFDRYRLTLNVWPVITTEGGVKRFGDHGYRDDLCSFIAEEVQGVRETEALIEIVFRKGTLATDLLEECNAADHVIFDDTVTNAWSYW
jgi:hypothetical protein